MLGRGGHVIFLFLSSPVHMTQFGRRGENQYITVLNKVRSKQIGIS